ncbi:SubName: Full=Uncharacterized protein {ECO:0000313/EMBL:CCA72852.1} [Serendipita indica DSM 11827]|nr:SubName: Full=Uncharacterized protein {ECO:0000313/EMBL:CCA72852.1} [Serendipita indica DSM 11827]
MSGLFGSSTFGTQQQPAATNPFGPKPSGTLGSALASSTAPSQPSGFSWGTSSTAAPSTPLPTSSLGGSGLFSSTATAKPGGFGLSTLGSSTVAPLQQQQPPLGSSTLTTSAAPTTLPVLNGAAKFNDLPQPIQDLLNDTEHVLNLFLHRYGSNLLIRSLIQSGLNAAKDLKGRKLGDSILTNTENSRQLFHDLTSSSNTLQADDLFAKNLRKKVDQAVQDVVVCTHIIDGFRESGIQHPNLKTNAQYPIECVPVIVDLSNRRSLPDCMTNGLGLIRFFVRLTDEMQDRLTRYKSIVDQLNRKLAFSFQAQQTPQAITTTLQSQHASFIALAAKVAEIEGSFEDVKLQFATLYKARTGSALDPFGRTPS